MHSVEDKMTFISDLYSPAPRQLEFHMNSFPHKVSLMLGPPLSGKSIVGLAECVWQSVMFPNNRGIYFTRNVCQTFNEFEILAKPWIEEANINPVNGLVTLKPIVVSGPNYLRFASYMDMRQFDLLRMQQFGHFVVDEVPWHCDFHESVMSRLRNPVSHRQGLYIYSGIGIPHWMRQFQCNQHFYKMFWSEDYIADFMPALCENLQEMETYSRHAIPPTISDLAPQFGFRRGLVSSPSPEHRATGLMAQLLRDSLHGINMTRDQVVQQMLGKKWKPAKPIDEPKKDEGIDDFIAEIDTLLDEPDDSSSIDEDALPKAAPTHGA